MFDGQSERLVKSGPEFNDILAHVSRDAYTLTDKLTAKHSEPNESNHAKLNSTWETQSKIDRKQSSDASNETYTVRRGDCLWTIADDTLKRDGISSPDDAQINNEIDRIVQFNKKKYPSLSHNRSLIYPGWHLQLPPAEVPAAAARAAAEAATGTSAAADLDSDQATKAASGAVAISKHEFDLQVQNIEIELESHHAEKAYSFLMEDFSEASKLPPDEQQQWWTDMQKQLKSDSQNYLPQLSLVWGEHNLGANGEITAADLGKIMTDSGSDVDKEFAKQLNQELPLLERKHPITFLFGHPTAVTKDDLQKALSGEQGIVEFLKNLNGR